MNDRKTLLLLLVSITFSYGQDVREARSHLKSIDEKRDAGLPTFDELEAACPDESEEKNDFKCAERAGRGMCSGKTTAAKVIRTKLCPCTCNKYLSDRIQSCCIAVGASSECMPLCRYNTTKEEVSRAISRL
jgi:hypothetical protein